MELIWKKVSQLIVWAVKILWKKLRHANVCTTRKVTTLRTSVKSTDNSLEDCTCMNPRPIISWLFGFHCLFRSAKSNKRLPCSKSNFSSSFTMLFHIQIILCIIYVLWAILGIRKTKDHKFCNRLWWFVIIHGNSLLWDHCNHTLQWLQSSAIVCYHMDTRLISFN